MSQQPAQPLDLDEVTTRAAHLDEYALLTDEPLQADLDQLTGTDVPALIDELRQARAELAAARSQALSEVEAEIAAAIDRNRAEHPDSEPMIARRLGMRAAERVVRGLREAAVETHVVADDSDTPEHIDDCPGCTRQCGHDDYHDPHEWHGQPGTWCPGHSLTDTQQEA